MTMLRRHTTAAPIKAKIKELLKIKVDFSLIQHMLALILRRYRTITCSTPRHTSFLAAEPSILWESTKMDIEGFLPPNRLSGIVVELKNWHKGGRK